MNDRKEATFYAVSSARYFPGAVGLLNSLRLLGHSENLVILSFGLTSEQRDMLNSHCQVVEIPVDLHSNPVLLKPFPALLNPSGIVVIIDSDVIVTSSLREILLPAQDGKIVVFPDPEQNRWFEEWQDLFQLPARPRRQMYVNSGFVAFSTDHWPHLLEHWWQACQRIPSSRTLAFNAPNRDPLAQGDQDAFNALLMSEIPQEVLAIQPYEAAPASGAMRTGGKVVNSRTLSCTYDGHSTLMLQSTGSPKPWEFDSWKRVWRNPYVQLLGRVLQGDDVLLRIPAAKLPVWLGDSLFSHLSLNALGLLNRTRYALRYGRGMRRFRKKVMRFIRS